MNLRNKLLSVFFAIAIIISGLSVFFERNYHRTYSDFLQIQEHYTPSLISIINLRGGISSLLTEIEEVVESGGHINHAMADIEGIENNLKIYLEKESGNKDKHLHDSDLVVQHTRNILGTAKSILSMKDAETPEADMRAMQKELHLTR